MVPLAIFDHVGRSLDQMENRLVSILHKNRGIGAFQGRIVKVNAGIAFFVSTRSIHHNLEIGRFAGHIVGARASNRSALVGHFDAAIVIFNRRRCARNFQENLRAVQSTCIFVVVFVVARTAIAGDYSARA